MQKDISRLQWRNGSGALVPARIPETPALRPQPVGALHNSRCFSSDCTINILCILVLVTVDDVVSQLQYNLWGAS